MKYALLGFLMATVAQAAEPVSDYGFNCTSVDAQFTLQAGVDPSGGFSTTVQSRGPYAALNGLNYISRHRQAGAATRFVSASYVKPRLTLTLDWSRELASDTYPAKLVINGKSALDLTCTVETF